MMGENFTIEGLNEAAYCFGDKLKVGNDVVLQITQPRQPCFKLGVKFGTQKIVKDFLNAPYPGLYVRILQEGEVRAGDKVEAFEKVKDGLPVLEFWQILFDVNRENNAVLKCLNDKYLSEEAKASFKRKLSAKANQ
jgi:MOSC domain-containing protein YiiM